MSRRRDQKISFVVLSFLTTTLIASFTLTPSSGSASTESNNNTLIQPDGKQGMGTTTNATSANTTIILVHGGWADGSSWGKVITILKNAGHRVIAVQLPLHNSADDIATVKRAVELAGGPVLLVGHSYGGFVITNAGSNNPNVTGLVYVAAFAPDEGESLGTYINPDMFHDAFAQDVNTTEADVMAIAQKPFNQSIFGEPSGPPAWKQLKTWYQVSDSDRMIPPDTQRMFVQRMNATTISIDTSHSSYVAHPDEIAQLILNAIQGSTGRHVVRLT